MIVIRPNTNSIFNFNSTVLYLIVFRWFNNVYQTMRWNSRLMNNSEIWRIIAFLLNGKGYSCDLLVRFDCVIKEVAWMKRREEKRREEKKEKQCFDLLWRHCFICQRRSHRHSFFDWIWFIVTINGNLIICFSLLKIISKEMKRKCLNILLNEQIEKHQLIRLWSSEKKRNDVDWNSSSKWKCFVRWISICVNITHFDLFISMIE